MIHAKETADPLVPGMVGAPLGEQAAHRNG